MDWLDVSIRVIVPIATAALGLAGGYFATRQQNKRDKLWGYMVETYCDSILDPLASAEYEIVKRIASKDFGYRSISEKATEAFKKKTDFLKTMPHAADLPQDFRVSIETFISLISDYADKLRDISIGVNNPKLEEEAEEILELMKVQTRFVVEASERIKEIKPSGNYSSISGTIENDRELDKIARKLSAIESTTFKGSYLEQ